MGIVYTAIFGNHDTLKEPHQVDDDWMYICLTDDKNLTSEHYDIVVVERKFKDDTRQAREVKLNPEEYLPEHDVHIWHDASMKMMCNPKNFVNRYLDNKGFSIMEHPTRNCTYKEAEACKHINKDNHQVIDKQMSEYKKQLFPTRIGMVASGVMIRKNEKHVNDFLKLWREEVEKYSKRDQLSFNFTAWKNKFKFNLMPFKICKGSSFKIGQHNRR